MSSNASNHMHIAMSSNTQNVLALAFLWNVPYERIASEYLDRTSRLEKLAQDAYEANEYIEAMEYAEMIERAEMAFRSRYPELEHIVFPDELDELGGPEESFMDGLWEDEWIASSVDPFAPPHPYY